MFSVARWGMLRRYLTLSLTWIGVVWNVGAEKAARVVQITTSYHGYAEGNFPPRIEDIVIEDLRCARAREGIAIKGVELSPIRRVNLRRVSVDQVTKPTEIKYAEDLHFERVSLHQTASK
jgi:hypothetical protein